MATILVTGASGFIGQGLAPALAGRHKVICLSRRKPAGELPWVRGDFAAFEDLRQLDKEKIDAVVHLGAVTGGGLERDLMLANVEGSRVLMRYLIDRGCKKFVMTSSIAAVGAQAKAWRPVKLPVPDEHPCLDRDGYGLSKFMMEEVTKYYARQNPQIDVINLRLAAISPDTPRIEPQGMRPMPEQWAACGLAFMTRADALRAFTLAVESPLKPGVRIMNASGPKIWATVPTAELLRAWWGKDVDLSWFEHPERRFDSVYDVRRIKAELGFVAKDLP